MKVKFILLTMIISHSLLAQNPQTYTSSRGDTHLCGTISIQDLQSGDYKKWFDKNYDALEMDGKSTKWKKGLKKTQVDIYLGTWCGDSRRWVPKFVKLWDELGLDREQLNFIALYNGEKSKQGPNGEEKGKNIHRVPTFIFKSNDVEYARIVEHPRTDLLTDVAQIALGYPSTPNYKGANYLMELFNIKNKEEVYADFKMYVNKVHRMVGRSGELNTLGYIYLAAGKVDEALTTFHFNTLYFKNNANVYDSYGEALAISGDIENAILNYEKVLKLDSDNENAKKQLEVLREKG